MTSILEQIDTSEKNNNISVKELEDAFFTDKGILFDIEKNTTTQENLAKELATIEPWIEESFLAKLIENKDKFGAKWLKVLEAISSQYAQKEKYADIFFTFTGFAEKVTDSLIDQTQKEAFKNELNKRMKKDKERVVNCFKNTNTIEAKMLVVWWIKPLRETYFKPDSEMRKLWDFDPTQKTVIDGTGYENKETTKTQNTADIIKDTALAKAMVNQIKADTSAMNEGRIKYPGKSDNEIAEKLSIELSNKLDTTRQKFIEGYFPAWANETLSDAVRQNLATGLSFAFMDWYNTVQSQKWTTENKNKMTAQNGVWNGLLDKINSFSTTINTYIAPITGVISGGAGAFAGIMGWLGTYAADLPLQSFFTKIQNTVTVMQTYQWQIQEATKGEGLFLNNPAQVVTFFQGMAETTLTPADIRWKIDYFTKDPTTKKQLADANLKNIAEKNWATFDAKTYGMLTKVVDMAPSILDARKDYRGTALSVYGQLDGLISSVWPALKSIFWEDVGSVKELLGKLGRFGDVALFLLGFNGVDDLARTYRREQVPGFSDEQNDLINGSLSRFKYADPKLIYKKDNTTEIDRNETHKATTSLLSATWFSTIKEKPDLTGIDVMKDGTETTVDIRPKIPTSFDGMKNSLVETLESKAVDDKVVLTVPVGLQISDYTGATLDGTTLTITNIAAFADTYVKKTSLSMLTNQEFCEAVATNDEFGSWDFMVAVVWSLFTPPNVFGKACAYGAFDDIGYGDKNLETKLAEKIKKEKDAWAIVNPTIQEIEQQKNTEVIGDDYLEKTWSNIEPVVGKNITKERFLTLVNTVKVEAENQGLSQYVPYILAQIHTESARKENAIWDHGQSFWLWQFYLTPGAHLDKVINLQDKKKLQEIQAINNKDERQKSAKVFVEEKLATDPKWTLKIKMWSWEYDLLNGEETVSCSIAFLKSCIDKENGDFKRGFNRYNWMWNFNPEKKVEERYFEWKVTTKYNTYYKQNPTDIVKESTESLDRSKTAILWDSVAIGIPRNGNVWIEMKNTITRGSANFLDKNTLQRSENGVDKRQNIDILIKDLDSTTTPECLISLGINRGPANIEGIKNLCKKLQAKGITPIVICPYMPTKLSKGGPSDTYRVYMQNFQTSIKDFAAKDTGTPKVKVVDLSEYELISTEPKVGEKKIRSEDGLHPAKDYYPTFTTIIKKELEKNQ